jgi:hypothetical protein
VKSTSVRQKAQENFDLRIDTGKISAGSKGLAIAAPMYGIELLDSSARETVFEADSCEAVQKKAGISASGSTCEARPKNRNGLPDNLKAGIEGLSGLVMDDVRVHYNSSRPAGLQALAYTQGTDIHVGPGQERHLPHEAWHVVQQKQGRVRATMQMAGAPINDDSVLEREADGMGAKAARQTVFQLKQGNATHAHDCGCSTCHPVQPLQRKVAQRKSSFVMKTIQMKKVTDDTMATVAGDVQGSSTHSTTAITKEADSTYKVYAQQKTSKMDDRIAQYENLSTGATNGTEYGFHAEVLALSEDLSWTKIAASQDICMRCQAILAEQGKTGVNNGDHYTSYWKAPGDYDIGGASTYPAAADHGGGDGSHGTRWTRKSDADVKLEDGAWQKIHKAPW